METVNKPAEDKRSTERQIIDLLLELHLRTIKNDTEHISWLQGCVDRLGARNEELLFAKHDFKPGGQSLTPIGFKIPQKRQLE